MTIEEYLEEFFKINPIIKSCIQTEDKVIFFDEHGLPRATLDFQSQVTNFGQMMMGVPFDYSYKLRAENNKRKKKIK